MKLTPVFVDVETYWDSDHTLSKMSPTEYVMSPKTEIISMSIKVKDYPTDVFFGEAAIRKALNSLDWSTKMAIGHNMSGFDAMILKWRFGIQPAMWGCTAAMARSRYAKTCGVSLAKLVQELGVGEKKDAILHSTKGRYLKDFTPEEIEAMKTYNREDTEQCAALFHKLVKGFPRDELVLIHLTTQMLVNPKFVLDKSLVETALSVERDQKRKALLELAKMLRADADVPAEFDWSDEDAVAEFVRSEMASAARFSKLLESCQVEVPMKPSPTNPLKMTPALAKTDDAFLKLQEHSSPLVAAAARVRLSVKSTLLETRLQAFLRAAEACNGRLPVPLKYAGADTTGRWSGEQYNMQNLPRIGSKPKTSDALRNSLKAPPGHKVVVADLSGIELRVNHFLWKVEESMELYQQDAEADLYRAFAAARYGITPDEVTKDQRQLAKLCLAEGTLVLTQRGEVPIEQVTASDKVWDGVEWVSTLGAVYKGVKHVIEYDGLTATPDHEVWVEDGRKVPLGYAAAQSLRLARTGDSGVPLGFDGAGVERDSGEVEPPVRQAERRVWDLLNCGPRHRFTANGRLVSNCQLGLGFGAGAATFRKVAKLMGGLELSEEEAVEVVESWRATYHRIATGWRICHAALSDIRQGIETPIDPWGMCVTEHEAIRLPSGRRIHYPALRQERDDKGKTEWWYGEGRHKARIYAGKITENCLAEGTLVLTDSGWKPIQSVSVDDLVHDGVEFVRHAGTVFKSVQGCIALDGVYMTPDHKVLTDDGWQEASQVQRPYRPDIRGVPHSAWEEPGRTGSYTVSRKPVYDIINCGPRHRFVVKGESGPMVVHNCVQALARDIIAGNAIDFWRSTKLEPALMVHDELVYVVPEAEADDVLNELQAVMRTPPKWWPELVTWSEGDIADSYGQAK